MTSYYRNKWPRVGAVVGEKGGIGKSLVTQSLGIIAAGRGDFDQVIIWDIDPNPGQTQYFDAFADIWAEDHGQAAMNYLAKAEASPDTLTINRVLLHPEQGLGGGILWQFPLTEMLQEVPHLRRIKIHAKMVNNVPLTTIQQQMFQQYGITLGKQSPLYVLPNTKNLRTIVAAMEARAATDRTFDPRTFIWHAIETLVNMGVVTERTLFLIDTAGEKGLLPDAAEWAADVLINIYTPGQLPLKGMISTMQNAARVRRDRGDPDGRPFIVDPIYNMAGQSDEEREWAETDVAKALAPYRLQPTRYVMSASPDIGRRAGLKGTPGFLYSPLDPACQTIFQLYQDVILPGAA